MKPSLGTTPTKENQFLIGGFKKTPIGGWNILKN